jgi:hypothetical protein
MTTICESGFHAGQDFGGVTLGFDFGPDFLDRSGTVDQNGAAGDSLETAAHKPLQAPRPVGFDHFVVRIAQQKKIQLLFCPEALEQLDRIGADTHDGHLLLVEFFFCVTKLGRLDRSTRGVGFGIKENDGAPALEVAE